MSVLTTTAPRDNGPLRSCGQRPGALAVLQARRLDRGLWRTPLVTSTFLAKLAVPPFGALGLSVAIPVMFSAGCIGAATGRMRVDMRRLLALLALLALLWSFQVLREGGFSPASMLLLTVLHLPYVFRLERLPDHAQVLDFFQSTALTIAVLGVLQYGVQFVVGPELAFPIENHFPESFRVSAFNMQGYLEYGSDIYRSNGVFMLEPSFFSQLIAIAIVVELTNRQRLWALGTLTAALLVSFSGTGIALLCACLLYLAIARRRWSLLGGLALAGIAVTAVATLGGNVPYVSVFLSRAGEFSSTGSSGFARFVGGYYLFEQFLWNDIPRALTGFGAGSFQGYSMRATYPVSGMAVFKMVFEFGLLGAIAYFAFLFDCVARASAPGVLRVGVGLAYVLSGNYIPFAHGLAFSLLIWTAPSRSDASPAP